MLLASLISCDFSFEKVVLHLFKALNESSVEQKKLLCVGFVGLPLGTDLPVFFILREECVTHIVFRKIAEEISSGEPEVGVLLNILNSEMKCAIIFHAELVEPIFRIGGLCEWFVRVFTDQHSR